MTAPPTPKTLLLLLAAGLCAGASCTSLQHPTGRGGPTAVEKVDVPPAIEAIVQAPDRTDEDRALDAGRHPAEMLAFFDIGPGMKVAELGAGGGYTTELLARAVEPAGLVLGQNSPFVLARFARRPWGERLRRPAMQNVIRLDRDFDDPFPQGLRDLDAVLIVLFYHDTVWLGADRDAMNRAVFAALKPGGLYGVIDHSAGPGSGVSGAKSLHRIEEQVVRDEVQRAGFRLVATADFLRNPDDSRDWNAAPGAARERRGTSDRFVLKFVKPL